MNTSLIINSTDTAGKAQQKTVTFLNPDVSNADAKTFAQLFNNLSSNTYVDADRVNKINVDDSDSSGGNSKQEPTLSVGTFNAASGSLSATITYNGDGQLFVNANAKAKITDENKLYVEDSRPITGTIYASEGDTFAAKSIPFSVS